MKNKVLFFSIDRLGDYLIRSNVIHSISKYYKSSDIICSEKNYKLINRQLFFNKVYLFDTTNKNKNKISFILSFFFRKYDALISFDGKNISKVLLFIIRANFKHIFLYKKIGFFNNIKVTLYCIFLKLIGITYTILNNRKLIENLSEDHYPSKYKSLKRYFSNIDEKTYYLENFDLKKNIIFNEKFILIHLDEKFSDILDIEVNFTDALNSFAKNLKKRIILTAYKNNNKYYKNLLIKKIPIENFDYMNQYKENIFILEDLPLIELNYLIKKSDLNISCHAGFLVHSSLYNGKKTIDLINKSDEKWLKAWITKNEFYKIIYKSDSQKKLNINELLTKLNNEINKI
jgi:ADP-heptose:LPS heptosyltransferase